MQKAALTGGLFFARYDEKAPLSPSDTINKRGTVERSGRRVYAGTDTDITVVLCRSTGSAVTVTRRLGVVVPVRVTAGYTVRSVETPPVASRLIPALDIDRAGDPTRREILLETRQCPE